MYSNVFSAVCTIQNSQGMINLFSDIIDKSRMSLIIDRTGIIVFLALKDEFE